MGKNPPAISEDTGSNPGLGKFHVPQGNKACVPLQSLCSRAWSRSQRGLGTENPGSATREGTVRRSRHTTMKHSTHSLQREAGTPQRSTAPTRCKEKPAHHNEAQCPLAASREGPCKVTKTQPAKNKYTKFKGKIKCGPKVIPHVKKT